MQVQLVFVRLGVVENLHVAALHSHSQPLSCGTVAQREDLDGGEREEKENVILGKTRINEQYLYQSAAARGLTNTKTEE